MIIEVEDRSGNVVEVEVPENFWDLPYEEQEKIVEAQLSKGSGGTEELSDDGAVEAAKEVLSETATTISEWWGKLSKEIEDKTGYTDYNDQFSFAVLEAIGKAMGYASKINFPPLPDWSNDVLDVVIVAATFHPYFVRLIPFKYRAQLWLWTALTVGGEVMLAKVLDKMGVTDPVERARTIDGIEEFSPRSVFIEAVRLSLPALAEEARLEHTKDSVRNTLQYLEPIIKLILSGEINSVLSGLGGNPSTEVPPNVPSPIAGEGSSLIAVERNKGGMIAKNKRGTFTAQASRMGMGVQEAARTILDAPEGRYSPEMRKKANFARNFAKNEGGLVERTKEGPKPSPRLSLIARRIR